MGDLARKILYPLVLPVIVAAVWGYAWTRNYDEQMNTVGPVVALPGSGLTAIRVATPAASTSRVELHFMGDPPLASGVGESDEFAATEYIEIEEE